MTNSNEILARHLCMVGQETYFVDSEGEISVLILSKQSNDPFWRKIYPGQELRGKIMESLWSGLRKSSAP